jgi:hypothetical protein
MLKREVFFLFFFLILKRQFRKIFCSLSESVRVEIVYFNYSSFLKRVEKQESERVREESVGRNKIIKGQ